MKTLPPAFAAHVADEVTTLAYCLRLTRRDGIVLGFTEHDRALVVDGTAFEPEAGFTASQIQQGLGLSVDNLTASGALSSDKITEIDILAGRYDDALVELPWANWADPTKFVVVMRGHLGEINRRGVAFSAHTAGAMGVFTVATAWTVTPSATAKFVVENDDDKNPAALIGDRERLYLWRRGKRLGHDDLRSRSRHARRRRRLRAMLRHCARSVEQPRHSHFFCLRGGASNAIDMLDIATGASGAWSADIAYRNKSQTFTTGTAGAYDPVMLGGKYLHLNVNGAQRFARLNMLTQVMETGTYLRFPQSTAGRGSRDARRGPYGGQPQI